LEHILYACNALLQSKEKYEFEIIKDDPVLFYGFVKLAEIIGEASNRAPARHGGLSLFYLKKCNKQIITLNNVIKCGGLRKFCYLCLV